MSNQLPEATTPAKLKPGELPLTLTTDVLRLPYPLATRAVLAEIMSLYAATGNCYCSDAHLAARLTISLNTVSRAVQHLEATGLIEKHVDKAAGNHRVLVPVPTAIKSTAATNPYPQNEGRGTTPKTGVGSTQNGDSPTPKTGDALSPKWGSNTTVNITENLQETSTLPAAEKKIGAGEFLEDSTSSLKAEGQLVPPVAEPPHAGQPGPVAAAELPAALATEAKQLAVTMGQLWKISEQSNFQKFALLCAFTKRQAQLGKLSEVRRQFDGYRLTREKAGLRAHKLTDWLGTAADDYAGGEWCGCDWPAVAADTRPRPGQPEAQPARASTSVRQTQSQEW